MFDGPARNSFRYALNPELLKLYGAVVAGWVFLGPLQSVLDGLPLLHRPLLTLVELPFLVLGSILFFGGLVGVLHRVVADATAE
ncbi:hypothetical protein ACFQJC_16260 [Haloferax namakaokahaiae]|uniref:Cox cluster protein n=1 Tax=Haloferax namakaokahaiae TaxID=1748331 RepID=A0ABD5ZJJ1_9EURY